MTPAPLSRMLRRAALAAALAVPLPALAGGEAAQLPDPAAAVDTEEPSRFRGDDGWLDVSGFLDQAYGFIPLVVPITEPAVGFGGAAALMFIDKPFGESAAGFGRPNITVIGGLGTENGTRGAFAGDMRHWLDDRLKTLVGVMQASINLDFYGIGRDPPLQRDPKSYNLDTRATVAQVRYRISDSPAWIGLGYVLARTSVGFDILPTPETLPEFRRESRVGGLLPHLSYDSRDNIFTPTSGSYLEASAGVFAKGLGGDSEFQRVNLVSMHFEPLARDLTFGINAGGVFSFGDVPFYLRPFIALRGVPAMRYQGDSAAQVEAELRWQFWQRFSLVGFAGAGRTWNDGGWNRRAQEVTSGGVGFRYEIARKYGLHMGVDVARGPDGPAWYIQVGSAWARP